jgi:ribosomal protein S4
MTLNKKLLKKKHKFFITKKYQTDIFGLILRRQKINKNFSLIYSKFYKMLFKKSSNIFFKIDRNNRQNFNRLPQKLRHIVYRRKKLIFAFYQNMKIHQIRKLYSTCLKLKGNLISNFLTKLELRLDMFIFRAFNLLSLSQIKQLIMHKKVYVNNIRVTHPNFLLKKFDIISFFSLSTFSINKFKMLNWLREGRLRQSKQNPWFCFISLYNYFLLKITKKNRKYLLHKHPKYIEVFHPLLIATCVKDILTFKEVPFLFNMRKHNMLNLFQL